MENGVILTLLRLMSSVYLQINPQWLWDLVPTIAVSWRLASSTRVVAKDPLYLNCYMSIYVPTTFSIVAERVCGLYSPLFKIFCSFILLNLFYSMVFLWKFFAQSFKNTFSFSLFLTIVLLLCFSFYFL